MLVDVVIARGTDDATRERKGGEQINRRVRLLRVSSEGQ
jgi:hypothetical protein